MSSQPIAEWRRPAVAVTPWPLAGSDDFRRVDAEWRGQSLAWFERTFDRHVVKPWFPRSIDRQRGGFHSEQSQRWKRLPERQRLLEHQARQSRSIARLAMATPDAEFLREPAAEALRYLRSAFWDAHNGGLFTLIATDGEPLLGGSKHAHGAAYAIGAAAEVFSLTGDRTALDFALDIFAWLDRHLYDPERGGYHGWATREGRPILTPADVPSQLRQRERDHLGHGVGLKDANVHTDLLEAFAVLVEAGGGEEVRARLDELYEVVAQRFTTPGGAVHYLTDAGLMPVPGLEQFGYPGQVGYRLCHAAAAIGRPLEPAFDQARVIADHMLLFAFDVDRGGVFEAGPAVDPTRIGGRDLMVRTHPWWVQTEAAQLLLTVALRWPDETRFRDALDRLLRFIERDLLDARYGGMLRAPRRELPVRRRVFGADRKADQWKDASHETDMWLRSMRMLAGLGLNQPLTVTS